MAILAGRKGGIGRTYGANTRLHPAGQTPAPAPLASDVKVLF